jgi:hypothetical protein
MTVSIVDWLAEANTSAGCPCVMPVARAELAPRFRMTSTSGFACSNCSSNVVNDSWSDAAANTVTVPERLPEADCVPDDPGLAESVPAESVVPESLELHPAASSAARAVTAAKERHLAFIGGLLRRRWWT